MELQRLSIRIITGKHFYDAIRKKVIPTCEDTCAYVNLKKVDFIFKKLNSHHPNILLKRRNNVIFLDALVKRSADQIETCFRRKETSTDFYIYWNAHAPIEWKTGTLINLVKRAKTFFSTTMLLHQEIEHLKAVFTENK